MAQYKLTRTNVILELESEIGFEARPDNRNYQEYLAWLDLGNTPLAADPEPLPDSSTVAKQSARQWYADNPDAALLFTLTIPQLQTAITNRVNALFPLATQGQRDDEILWRMAVSVSLRVFTKQLGLVE